MGKRLPSRGGSTGRSKRFDQAIRIALFGFVAFILLLAGAFSGTYLSTSLEFLLPAPFFIMVTDGVAAPTLRKRKGKQTEQDNRLEEWSFLLCLLFVGGTGLMVINAPLFKVNLRGLAFSLNSAQVGYVCTIMSFIFFSGYYLWVHHKAN